MRRCVLCGEPLNENGLCPNMAQHYKPMCLNCLYCAETLPTENGETKSICTNEQNKADAVEKIKASFEGNYQINDISLSPLPLKDPSKRCPRHNLNCDLVLAQIVG